MIHQSTIKKHKLELPFFLYDFKKISQQYLSLKKFFPKNIHIFYFAKANPNAQILKAYKSLGSGVEVSSFNELKNVLEIGFSPKNVILVGPGKTNDVLKLALKKRIYLIIAESTTEIKRIDKIAGKQKIKQDILIRVNPLDFDSKSNSKFSMVGNNRKFGIDEEKIPNIIKRVWKLNNVNIVGLHFFTGSYIYDERFFIRNTRYLFKLVCFLESNSKIFLPIINIGGGFPLNHYVFPNRLFDIKNLYKGLKDLVKQYGFENRTILFESGRFLVGKSGEYIVEVIDVKKSRNEKFVIINGGINHISLGALKRNGHEVEIIGKKGNKKEVVNIVGNLCLPMDFITKTKLPNVKIGDIISIKKVGAYGLTSGMILFSSYRIPDEYILVNNRPKRINNKIRA